MTVVELGLGARAALAVDGRGRVVAVYRRAAYLRVPGGLVALTTPDVWRGPLHVRSAVAPERLAPGDVVDVVGGSHVRVGRAGVVDLAGASVWRGTLPALTGLAEPVTRTAPSGRFVSPVGDPCRTGDTYSPERARRVTSSGSAADRWIGSAAELFASAPPSALLGDERFAGRLGVAVHRLRQGDLAGVARAIGGLGPGLTPAGDDTLAGILLVARARGGEAAEDGLVAVARGVATTSVAPRSSNGPPGARRSSRPTTSWSRSPPATRPPPPPTCPPSSASATPRAPTSPTASTSASATGANGTGGPFEGPPVAIARRARPRDGSKWHRWSRRGTDRGDRSEGPGVGVTDVSWA